MLISRNLFLCCLFVLLTGPIIGARLYWLAGTRHTMGVLYFVGHDGLGSTLGITTYPVILFRVGKDSFEFKGKGGIDYKIGGPVPVRYRVDNPYDAKIDKPLLVWGDVGVDLLVPVIVWLVLVLTPKRFDPLIPAGSMILLRRKWPIVWIVSATDADGSGACKDRQII